MLTFFFFRNVDGTIIQVILGTFLNVVPRDVLRLSVSLSKYYKSMRINFLMAVFPKYQCTHAKIDRFRQY